jgi:AmmeMemoRadiSam system protein B
MLRDPLQLTDRAVVLPRELAPFLALCDGTRDVRALRAALALRFGLRVGEDVLESVIRALDGAYLLENARFVEAKAEQLEAFQRAPFRSPTLAGYSYPDDPADLSELLASYTPHPVDGARAGADIRGLVSPHIDFARGGPTYGRVWAHASEAVLEAEVAIMLGTDHYGEDGRLTLTHQNYATPFGVLPTARDVVDDLAAAVGEDAFADELHHRSEHSIELAAVWLHYVRGGRTCQLVPILCGSFAPFVENAAGLEEAEAIAGLISALRRAMVGRRAVIVAAGDLAHVGPAFGGPALGALERAQLRATDRSLVERICAGDASGFFEAIRRVGDRHNVCGLPPIYLTLRALDPTHGEVADYAQCPADEEGASLVTVCGIVFHQGFGPHRGGDA